MRKQGCSYAPDAIEALYGVRTEPEASAEKADMGSKEGDNPTVIRSRVAGALRPDLVIPFKLEKDAAVAALKKHYVKRPFLPRCFKDENRIQSIKGIYVPFFLFDYTASGISDLYSK